MEDDKKRIIGVFPAALDPARTDTVTSHPGLTSGGVVHEGALKGPTMLEAVQDISSKYREMGLELLRYKVVPSTDDRYALFRLGAVRYHCDLSPAIDLDFR